MKASRVHALISGRSYVTHADIQAIALPVLGHRIILRPEAEMDGKRADDVVKEIIASVPVMVEGRTKL
jgi:MoxR-like ATPase